MKNKKIKYESEPFYAIADETHINHTTLALTEADAIHEFMEQERTMYLFVNAGRSQRKEKTGPAPSWEYYEAEGYRVVKVKIVEIENEKDSPASS